MATIDAGNSSQKKRGVRLMKRYQTRIDMTPMVDLGFLLITFFVMTARLSEPSSLSLVMPKDGAETPVGETSALTVLVDGKNIFYYTGEWSAALRENKVIRTTLHGKTGLRQVILDCKQRLVNARLNDLGSDGLMLLMKAGPDTDYNTVVNLMDETMISHVTRHAFVKIEPEELAFIRK
ncbi:MAG: biopolymer transporter ExbD [Chitinophagaceae bacterium]|nr:MAG: biopolymer transporter ExbD [Chitinophagaceae bacterium]